MGEIPWMINEQKTIDKTEKRKQGTQKAQCGALNITNRSRYTEMSIK